MEPVLTCAALQGLIAARASITLVDVRRQPAFEAEPRLISDAIRKDPEQVPIWAAELNQDRPVVVYCVHGHEVSKGVVECLRALDFDAALLEGGFEAWKAARGPVIPASGET